MSEDDSANTQAAGSQWLARAALGESGDVITFYSYKGGTGRTMGLVNCAGLIARQLPSGARPILLMDFDLEAPGLHRYLQPFLVASDQKQRPGVIEMFEALASAVSARLTASSKLAMPDSVVARNGHRLDDESTQTLVDEFDFTPFIVRTKIAGLNLILAGRFDLTYDQRLARFDWEALYDIAPALFRSIGARFAREYSYTFIDSRTGLSDTTGICTMLLPNVLVVVFTPNGQSLTGIEHLVRRAVNYRESAADDRGLRVYPLPSRVDNQVEHFRQVWRSGDTQHALFGPVVGYEPLFQRIFGAALQSAGPESVARLHEYFDLVQVPHTADYAYGERLCFVSEAPSDSLSIRNSYEQFLPWLATGAQPWQRPADVALNQEARRWLRRFRADREPTDASGWEAWFEQLAHALDRPTHAIVREYASLAPDVRFDTCMVLMLANAFSRNGAAAVEWMRRADDAYDDGVATSVCRDAPSQLLRIWSRGFAGKEFDHKLAEWLVEVNASMARWQPLKFERRSWLLALIEVARQLRLPELLFNAESELEGIEPTAKVETRVWSAPLTRRRVFLASSTELAGDRLAFEIQVNRRNKTWMNEGVFVELITWESAVNAISQTRLQDEFNKTLSECDVFVMLLWTNLGKYTEEEFEHALGLFRATRRPFIFTYFKDAPVNTGSVDIQGLLGLDNFKKRLDTLGHFYMSYKNVEDLQLHFLQQLDRMVANGFSEFSSESSSGLRPGRGNLRAHIAGDGAISQGAAPSAAGPGGVVVVGNNGGAINTGALIERAARHGASAQELRRAYLSRIVAETRQLPTLVGAPVESQFQASAVYMAPLAAGPRVDGTTEGADLRDDGPPKRAPSAVEVLNAEPRLVLLGGPGSGKSTFLKYVALTMAGELLGMATQNLASLTAPVPGADDGHHGPMRQRWDHGPLLPVQVILRDFAAQLPAPSRGAVAPTLWDFIRGSLKQIALDDFGEGLLEELRTRGGLVLLDGLDEVPDTPNTRERVMRSVRDFAAAFAKCRIVVTSRTYAYQWQNWKRDGFVEAHLLPFTTAQIESFVDASYAHAAELMLLTSADARVRADALKSSLGRSGPVRELVRSPLMLTLVTRMQTERGILPEGRADFYEMVVELLLNQWDNIKLRFRVDGTQEVEPSLTEWLNSDRVAIRKELNHLAYEALRDQRELSSSADITQAKLVAALLRATKVPDVKIRRLEEYLRDRAGILSEVGCGIYQFVHRSVLEYLAACHLTEDDFPDKLATLVRMDVNRWREVALLAGAKAAQGSQLSAWALSESLCLEPPTAEAAAEADHWGALLAGRVLVESADLTQVAKRNAPKLARVREWQRTIMRSNTLPAVERALAGRTLAALGDPRPEVMTLAGMHFCLVPPGPFVMGDSCGGDDEKPEHTVDLAYPYFIARFPVTVAQWREILQHSGRAPDDKRSLAERDNDPAMYVTWHDATHLCDELTRSWQALMPKGFIITLPSEAEWEKAARGGEHIPAECDCLSVHQLGQALATAGAARERNPFPRRSYPWGDSFDAERANTVSQVGGASAVGCYSTGRSPYGCEDMIGIGLEWTRSPWLKYPYAIGDQTPDVPAAERDIFRVVRGGSCSYRARRVATEVSSSTGFRLVLRSAISSVKRTSR